VQFPQNRAWLSSTATRVSGRAWLAVLLSSCLGVSCGAEATSAPTAAVCDGAALTYDNFGARFMSHYCVDCHSATLPAAARNGAPRDHNFDTLAGIRDAEVEHIDSVAAAGPAAVNDAMPPPGYPQPSEAERRQLGQWLACGAH
jgi:uncharacterized membrane protein